MPPKRQRPNNFFEVGVQGRKTGITLKDTGIRDEHGLEPIEGIFSSPAKSPARSPAKRSGNFQDATITMSEEMELQQSSAPEPTETISARKLTRSKKAVLPPPRGKSPVKTNVGSSPRRQSVVPPPQTEAAFIAHFSPSPRSLSRRLDFSATAAQRNTLSVTPERSNGVVSQKKGSNRKSDIYDLTPSPKRGQKRSYDKSLEEGIGRIDDGEMLEPNGSYEDVPMALAGDESLQVPIEQEDDASMEQEGESETALQEPPISSPIPQRKSKSRKELGTTTSQTKKGRQAQPTSRRAEDRPKNAGRPKKASRASDSIAIEPSILALDLEEPPKKRRTRPTAVKSSAVDMSDISQSVDESVITRDSSVLGSKRKGRPPNSARKDPVDAMPPPQSRGQKREPKLANSVRLSIDAALGPSTVRGGSVPRSDVSQATKSNVVLRSQTPFDNTFGRTRSGRAIIPPINYYLGERVEYKSDGTLQNVVKAEIAPQHKRTGQRNNQRARPRQREFSVFAEAEEDELEEWEREEPGVLSGYVHRWDEEFARETDIVDEIELAMAYKAIQPRDIANGEFSYARIFGGFPWFSNGIVKIPPGGAKRPKPSRKMHLVFFVIRGQVDVTIGNNAFRINSGGAFQVPRGNTYGIDNFYHEEAQLFFTQASQPTVEIDG